MFENDIKNPILFIVPQNIFHKRLIIHSFFMKIPIDIMVVNDRLEIIDKTSLMPWHYYKVNEEIACFIELEYGYLNKHNIKINDKIKII